MRKLKEINARQMNKTRQGLHLAKSDPAMEIIASEHERVVSARMGINNNKTGNMVAEVIDIAENGLYLERILIQQMLEQGRLSHKTAKEMQANITLLEAQLHTE
jgi:hypothetical protein